MQITTLLDWGLDRLRTVALNLGILFMMSAFQLPTLAYAIDDLFAELQNLDTPPVNTLFGAADMNGDGDIDILAKDDSGSFLV